MLEKQESCLKRVPACIWVVTLITGSLLQLSTIRHRELSDGAALVPRCILGAWFAICFEQDPGTSKNRTLEAVPGQGRIKGQDGIYEHQHPSAHLLVSSKKGDGQPVIGKMLIRTTLLGLSVFLMGGEEEMIGDGGNGYPPNSPACFVFTGTCDPPSR